MADILNAFISKSIAAFRGSAIVNNKGVAELSGTGSGKMSESSRDDSTGGIQGGNPVVVTVNYLTLAA